MSGRILYGTSSWSESSWKGVFYPAGMKPGDFLSFYAGRYPTVEADVTYYRIPSPAMVQGWDRKTPEGFILSAKFPRSIVHGGEAARPDAEHLLLPGRVGADAEQFLQVMSLLGEKCGPLVLQFPYFNRQVFAGPEPFLERLDAFLSGLPEHFRYAVEVRNRDWLAPPLLGLLRRHRAALVLVDLNYMPHPEGVSRHMDLVTTDFTFVRLIGDRKAVEEKTESFDRIVVDRTDRLRRWASLLRDLRQRVETALVYANNHFAGHAPATIAELAALVEED